jgi:hypothetical protein
MELAGDANPARLVTTGPVLEGRKQLAGRFTSAPLPVFGRDYIMIRLYLSARGRGPVVVDGKENRKLEDHLS